MHPISITFAAIWMLKMLPTNCLLSRSANLKGICSTVSKHKRHHRIHPLRCLLIRYLFPQTQLSIQMWSQQLILLSVLQPRFSPQLYEVQTWLGTYGILWVVDYRPKHHTNLKRFVRHNNRSTTPIPCAKFSDKILFWRQWAKAAYKH